MKKRLARIFIVLILFIVLPIVLLAIDVITDFYPKSKDIRLKQTMASNFWEQRGVHKRTCKHIQWFFVAVANYEPVEMLQYYEEKWNREPKPVHPALTESEYQGRFFPIFSFTTSKSEISMDKYLGYINKSNASLEYEIGTHMYFCKLDDWNE